MLYVGRDMNTPGDEDRRRRLHFIGHVEATLDSFKVPAVERAEVLAFVNSLKADILE